MPEPLRWGSDENPLTRKEANILKDHAVKQNALYSGSNKEPEFTCSTCVNLAWCEYAYDLYNQDGDCLALK